MPANGIAINSNGLMAVGVADLKHINPVLEGLLLNTNREAQLRVLNAESRSSRFSSAATSAAATPDNASIASKESRKEKKEKKSLFSTADVNKFTLGVRPAFRL